jgi:hypothetical protein
VNPFSEFLKVGQGYEQVLERSRTPPEMPAKVRKGSELTNGIFLPFSKESTSLVNSDPTLTP